MLRSTFQKNFSLVYLLDAAVKFSINVVNSVLMSSLDLEQIISALCVSVLICSKSKLDSELEKLTKIFLENGYPEDVISVYIKEKIGNFPPDIKFGPQKCPVYLKLPWKGNSSLRFESQIKQAITNFFFAVNPPVVYSTKKALPSIQKDCVPATRKSFVVYEFTCQCDSGYVGRTTQRLEDRIKQHVPSNIRNKTHPQREQPPWSCKSQITTKTCDSAIGQHLLENPDCAKKTIMATCF